MRATDAAGNLSPYSNVATATTPPPDTQPPTAPANLTATAVSASQINLSWTASTDNVGVTGYLVERAEPGLHEFRADRRRPRATTYNDTGLAASSSYSYRVRATDAAGNLSAYSNVASATTTGDDPGPGGGVLVQRRHGDDGRGLLGQRQHRHDRQRHLDHRRQVRQRAGLQRHQCPGDDPRRGLAAPDDRHDAGGLGQSLGRDQRWRDVIYKGNDNYYLEATSTQRTCRLAGALWARRTCDAYGTAALTANTWTYLAATYDGATLRLYVNGTQVSSLAQTGNIATSTNPLQIGGDSIYGQYFTGMIDEVRVYNVALTAAQIQADMNTPIATPDTQPPTAPANLTATASASQINLSWTASTDNVGVTSYLVEREDPGSIELRPDRDGHGHDVQRHRLDASSTYSYRVRATDAAGNLARTRTWPGHRRVCDQPARGDVDLHARRSSSRPTSAGVTWSVDGVLVDRPHGNDHGHGLIHAAEQRRHSHRDGHHVRISSRPARRFTSRITREHLRIHNDNLRTGAEPERNCLDTGQRQLDDLRQALLLPARWDCVCLAALRGQREHPGQGLSTTSSTWRRSTTASMPSMPTA